MTDELSLRVAVECPEEVATEVVGVLYGMLERHPLAWWTAREVQRCLVRWPGSAVRSALRGLADAGAIEGRVGGSGEHPLREYRAKQ